MVFVEILSEIITVDGFFCISDFRVRNSFIHTGMSENTKKTFQCGYVVCSVDIVPYAQLSGEYV